MKKVRSEEAIGLTLCHDITAIMDGFKGVAFKRGHVITEDDVPRLLDIGKQNVYIWEENAGEVHEEDCALRMAAMASIENGRYEGPSEGKVTLRANEPGMFRVDKELLTAVNAIGDITISTLPDHYPVQEDDRLASMRIVPLVTQEAQILKAEELCKGKRLFRLMPYVKRKVGVIITGSEIYHGRIQDKFEPICRAKLQKFPHEIVGVAFCDDELDMIISKAEEFMAKGADLLIFSGGMSVDPDDLTPTAIRKLADNVVSYGVPSQPGNMTLVAYRGDVTLTGVPGASIKMPTTVFDVLLPQMFTEEKLTKADLLRLADGGLCQQCKSCHYPNCTFGRY